MECSDLDFRDRLESVSDEELEYGIRWFEEFIKEQESDDTTQGRVNARYLRANILYPFLDEKKRRLNG